jgi:hypothetical protein
MTSRGSVDAAHAVDRNVFHEQLRLDELILGPIAIDWLLGRFAVCTQSSRDSALVRLS